MRYDSLKFGNVLWMFFITFDLSIQARYSSDRLEKEYQAAPSPMIFFLMLLHIGLELKNKFSGDE